MSKEAKLLWQRNDRLEFKRVHGYSQNLFYRFGGNRHAVLERDGFKCVKCGMTDEQHKAKWNRPITVDHKDKNQKNNALDNLQTLCLTCHGSKDLIPRLRVQKVPAKKEEILALRAQGLTCEEIGKRVGFGMVSIWKWLKIWAEQN